MNQLIKINSLIFLFILILFAIKTPAYAVTVTITSAPSPVAINEEFNVSFAATDLEINTQYYGKIRLGTNNTYTKGETKNGDTWLGDTSSWTSFPTFTTDSSGSLNATIIGRAKSTAEVGTNQLFVRLRKVGSSTNVSPDGETTINITETVVPTPTPTSTPIPTPTSSPTNTPTPIKTPTPTAAKSPTATPTPKPTPTPTLTASTPTTAKAETLALGEVLSNKVSSESPEINLATLAASETPQESSPTAVVAGEKVKIPQALIFIVGGFLLAVSGIILIWKKYISAKAPTIQQD